MNGGMGKEKVRLNDLGQNIGWMSIDLDLLASLHSPKLSPTVIGHPCDLFNHSHGSSHDVSWCSA